MVASPDFHHGVPPEVEGTGLTPQAWVQTAPRQLTCPKNKECAIRLSPRIAQRKGDIAGASMHFGIQSLLNELQPEVPFEQYVFWLN